MTSTQFEPIIDTPAYKFKKVWNQTWVARAYKALKREFAKPTLPIRFPMTARDYELNRNYYAKLGEQKQ